MRPAFDPPAAEKPLSKERLLSVLSAAASALALAVVGYEFLPHETIWIDETTQLTGLRLGPLAVIRWLMGDGSLSGGVPMDRMPPLSYWLLQLWVYAFGSGEHSSRMFGLLCATVATFVLALAANKISGWKGAALVGVAFALCSSNPVYGVSIRAYPLLMLWASVAWYAAIEVVTDLPRFSWRSLVLLGSACILGVFCHLYAAVMTATLLTALLVAALVMRARPWPLVLTGGAVALSVIGLVPFILYSTTISQTPFASDSSVGRRLARLVARLVVSPSLATLSGLAVLALAAMAVLVAVALWRSEQRRIALFAFGAVALGLGLGFAAAVLRVGFDSLAPHYNLWLCHGVLLVGAAAFAASSGRARLVAAGATAVLLVSNLAGVARLLRHPGHFSHGPERTIEELLTQTASSDVAVAHDAAGWAWSYFPLRYEHGTSLEQYRTSPDGHVLTRIDNGLEETKTPAQTTIRSLSHRYLLVVSAQSLNTADVAADLAGRHLPWKENPLSPILRNDPAWKLVRRTQHISHVGGWVELFERVHEGARPQH